MLQVCSVSVCACSMCFTVLGSALVYMAGGRGNCVCFVFMHACVCMHACVACAYLQGASGFSSASSVCVQEHACYVYTCMQSACVYTVCGSVCVHAYIGCGCLQSMRVGVCSLCMWEVDVLVCVQAL